MNPWLRVEDELPKEYGYYQVLIKRKYSRIFFFNVQKQVWQYDAVSATPMNDVTHWSYLPLTPKLRYTQAEIDEFDKQQQE